MRSVIPSVIHSLPPSLSPPLDSFHLSSEWESGVTVMWWGYTDCQDGLLPWEICTHARTHNDRVPHKCTDRIPHACVHPSSHTITHMRDHTITNPSACKDTHTRSSELPGLSAEGPSIWHHVPVENRPIVAPPPPLQPETHKHTPAIYPLPFTFALFKTSLPVRATESTFEASASTKCVNMGKH